MSETNGKQSVGQVEDLPSVIVDEAALNGTGNAGSGTTAAAEAQAAAPTDGSANETGAADVAEEEFMLNENGSAADDADDAIGAEEAAETADADADKLESEMAERERKWKLAGKIAIIAGAVIVSILLAVGVAHFVGNSVKDGVTALTGGAPNTETIVAPAIKGVDASKCQPGQWYLKGNELVFENCAVPIFGEK